MSIVFEKDCGPDHGIWGRCQSWNTLNTPAGPAWNASKMYQSVSGTTICFPESPEVGDSGDKLYQKTAEVGKSPLNSCAVPALGIPRLRPCQGPTRSSSDSRILDLVVGRRQWGPLSLEVERIGGRAWNLTLIWWLQPCWIQRRGLYKIYVRNSIFKKHYIIV